MLLALIAKPGTLLTRIELIHSVWPEVVVEDNNLTVLMSTLRKLHARFLSKHASSLMEAPNAVSAAEA